MNRNKRKTEQNEANAIRPAGHGVPGSVVVSNYGSTFARVSIAHHQTKRGDFNDVNDGDGVANGAK